MEFFSKIRNAYRTSNYERFAAELNALNDSLISCKNYDNRGQYNKSRNTYTTACKHYDKSWEFLSEAFIELGTCEDRCTLITNTKDIYNAFFPWSNTFGLDSSEIEEHAFAYLNYIHGIAWIAKANALDALSRHKEAMEAAQNALELCGEEDSDHRTSLKKLINEMTVKIKTSATPQNENRRTTKIPNKTIDLQQENENESHREEILQHQSITTPVDVNVTNEEEDKEDNNGCSTNIR